MTTRRDFFRLALGAGFVAALPQLEAVFPGRLDYEYEVGDELLFVPSLWADEIMLAFQRDNALARELARPLQRRIDEDILRLVLIGGR